VALRPDDECGESSVQFYVVPARLGDGDKVAVVPIKRQTRFLEWTNERVMSAEQLLREYVGIIDPPVDSAQIDANWHAYARAMDVLETAVMARHRGDQRPIHVTADVDGIDKPTGLGAVI
jgi:hypothetical protein